jgi:hypothetical protein
VTITSNVQGVIDRTRKRPRDIAAAMAATLLPEAWAETLRLEAQKTLWAIAKPEEWQQVKLFIPVVDKLADGFFAALNNPIPPILGIEDFAIVSHMQAVNARDGQGGPNLFSNLLNQFDALVAEWVATEKHKDKRDWDKSDEEIGHFIGYLLVTPAGKLSPKEKAAKAGFLRHLPQWLEKKQQSQRISDDTVNAWLLAVLAAWKALVLREFPGRFAAQLGQEGERLL